MNDPMPGKGAATGSLVCGIVGLVLSILGLFVFGFLCIVGLILGIVGLALAASAKNAGFVGGARTGGMVLSILAVVFGAVALVACIACAGIIGAASSGLSGLYY